MIYQPQPLYLASRSPRRRELLEQMGITYQLVDVEVDETPYENEKPQEYVARLAQSKAEAGFEQVTKSFVLGADTAVVKDGVILGKPVNQDHFIEMFQRLSGHTHQVISGIALVGEGGYCEKRISISQVTFREIEADELQSYWLSGEPVDKAGGYAIQGYGAAFIRFLQGSYSGVMGLPLFELVELLSDAYHHEEYQ
jgi:septum formation protein